MNYLRIFKKSVKTIWKNKFLFVFGFLAVLLSVFSDFGLNFKDKAEFDIFIAKLKQFASVYPQRSIVLLIFALIIFIVLLFFKIVGNVGLIKCANNIDAGREGTNFQLGFKMGIKKFWQLLILKLLLGLVVLAALVILIIPCLFMFANQLYVPGVILSLLALVIFVPLLVVVFFSRIYSERYLVVDEYSVLKSIKMGANLFLENVKASLVMILLLFLLNIAAAIVLFFGLFIIFLPFLAVGFVLSIIFSGLGSVLVVIGVVPALIISAVIVSVVWTTFQSIAWTLTFRQIR